MTPFTPLKTVAPSAGYKPGDVFVLFGELFSRGYANGLIDQAKAAGMKIVGITVGRRDADGELRSLTDEELKTAEETLGGTIVNVPLWAGFDMDAPKGETKPGDMLAGVKTKGWDECKLDWDLIAKCKEIGDARFKSSAAKAMAQIKELIPEGSNVLFAHTMAGGIPRAKIMLALTNRVLKGTGKKYMSSAEFWASDIGRLAEKNFEAVTAETLGHLIDASAEIRDMVENWNGRVRYTAYGYHGTEVLIDGKLQWQSYNPYLQGKAKIKLETIAGEAFKEGVKATVFNCPEIRTNSSDIFSGVELSLYPLITQLQRESDCEWVKKQIQICADKLKDDCSIEDMLKAVDEYHVTPQLQDFYNDFEAWPRHNTQEQAEIMLAASEQVMGMNEDRKNVVTDQLSKLVVNSTGRLMFVTSWDTTAPVFWLGHDVISQDLVERQPKIED